MYTRLALSTGKNDSERKNSQYEKNSLSPGLEPMTCVCVLVRGLCYHAADSCRRRLLYKLDSYIPPREHGKRESDRSQGARVPVTCRCHYYHPNREPPIDLPEPVSSPSNTNSPPAWVRYRSSKPSQTYRSNGNKINQKFKFISKRNPNPYQAYVQVFTPLEKISNCQNNRIILERISNLNQHYIRITS